MARLTHPATPAHQQTQVSRRKSPFMSHRGHWRGGSSQDEKGCFPPKPWEPRCGQYRHATTKFRGTQSHTKPLLSEKRLECGAIPLKRLRQGPSAGERGAYLFSAQILAVLPCCAASDHMKPPVPQDCPLRPLPGQVARRRPPSPAWGERT